MSPPRRLFHAFFAKLRGTTMDSRLRENDTKEETARQWGPAKFDRTLCAPENPQILSETLFPIQYGKRRKVEASCFCKPIEMTTIKAGKNSKHSLSPTMEDYLEVIYHLANEHGAARSRMIVDRLGVHKSTVTTALRSLSEQGYIKYTPYQEVTLTKKGILEARGVVRRHEIFYRLLRDLLEVEPEEAEELACLMEHALPPDIVDRFSALVEKALRRKKGIE